MNSKLNAPNGGQVAEHHEEKELYFSCYIQGMKAYLKSKFQLLAPKLLKRIDTELEQSESKR